MTTIPQLRQRVVDALQRFDEPAMRDAWLTGQTMLWQWEPSAVLSLLVAGRPLPSEPFAALPAAPLGQRPDDCWGVLDVTLLTATPVWLLNSPARRTRPRSWVQIVEALWGLLNELAAPLPYFPTLGVDALDAAPRTAATLLLEVTCHGTSNNPAATGIACSLVWKALGFTIDAESVPVPATVGDPIDGWHDTLEVLTIAQSAAATVLTVLAVEGGGREVRSLSLIKEG